MKYYIKIFGCQMNQSDAERISALLEKYKFKKASSIDEADLIIFVTCGVRQSAEDRVYGQINNIKKKHPDKQIVLTGCLAHRKDVQRRLEGKVDLFMSINDFLKETVSVIARSETTKQSRVRCIKYGIATLPSVARDDKNNYLQITPQYSSKYTAFVPVMTGCNNFCAYCVVPYARGREYSRPAEDIIEEIKNLVKKGCKEIMLLGQNVNSYKNLTPTLSLSRRGSEKEINFPKLLKLIEKIPGNFWLTFLTSHPKDMSDELIETITRSKKICEYVSLPAQSGDNEILRKMNRKYTIEHYKNLIKKIRKAFLRLNLKNFQGLALKIQPAISTDIIVGFPGETKKQFENTARLLKEMKFDMAYIAQYSPRPETAAWKLKNNVSKKEKARREKVLTDILAKTALANNKKYISKTVEVLVDANLSLREAKRRSNPEFEAQNTGSPRSLRSLAMTMYRGHTRTQKKVIFSSNKKIPIGRFVKVAITEAKAFGLEGKIK